MLFDSSFGYIFKIILVAVLMYVIVFSLLLKLKLFSESKSVSSLIALISVIIVSFTGVLTYAVSYAITWFSILLFFFFLIFVILTFLGVKIETISSFFDSNSKTFLIIFVVLFSIIIVKSFFALNNAYDLNNPQNNSYSVNTEFNTGVDDVMPEDSDGFFSNLNINSDLTGSVLFLIVIGIFVMLI